MNTYEYVLADHPSGKSSCNVCIFHNARVKCGFAPDSSVQCEPRKVFMLVHKISGIPATLNDLSDQYLEHKKEVHLAQFRERQRLRFEVDTLK